MIHHTTTEYEGKTIHWASLDGDFWLPVSRAPEAGDEEAIAALFAGDGNFMPMTFGTTILRREGADV